MQGKKKIFHMKLESWKMTERKTNQSWEFIQRIRKSDARNKFGAKSKNPMDLDETENVK